MTVSNEPRLRACPQCGDIRSIYHGRVSDRCRRGLGQGHIYRMLTVEEMTASAERNERDGYHGVAIKRALIRDALLRGEM